MALDSKDIFEVSFPQTNTYSFSGQLLFLHLTDEPESKKLAAQSDLDSAKALCESILLSYYIEVYKTHSLLSLQ